MTGEQAERRKEGRKRRGVRSRVIGSHWSAWCRTRASLQLKLPSNERLYSSCVHLIAEKLAGNGSFTSFPPRVDESMDNAIHFFFLKFYPSIQCLLLLYPVNFIETFLSCNQFIFLNKVF